MEGPLVERVFTLCGNSSIMLKSEALYVLANAYGMAEKKTLYEFATDYKSTAFSPLVHGLTCGQTLSPALLSEIIAGIEALLRLDFEYHTFDKEETMCFHFDCCDGFSVLE